MKNHYKGYTIIAPDMAPVQFALLEQQFQNAGIDLRVTKEVTPAAIELALRSVNNDVCYPAIITIGQVVHTAIGYRAENPGQKTAVILTQTGGGCRASQYPALARRALANLGETDIPVIPLSLAPLKGQIFNPLGIGLDTLKNILDAILLGDVIMILRNATKPYESTPGETQDVTAVLITAFRQTDPKKVDRESFEKDVKLAIKHFNRIQIPSGTTLRSKPCIGVVGEIYVKYNPFANNNLVDLIEKGGCEASVGPIVDFFLYCLSGAPYQRKDLARNPITATLCRQVMNYIESRKKLVNTAFAKSERYRHLHLETIDGLRRNVEGIISTNYSMGEGWLLAAEAVECIKLGIPHVVNAQPLSCLANHCGANGVIAPISARYPDADIKTLEYDFSASGTNQENRLEVLINNAKRYFAEKISKMPPAS